MRKMDRTDLEKLLRDVESGAVGIDRAAALIETSSFCNLTHSRIDMHRELRTGVPEVVYAGTKGIGELSEIVRELFTRLGGVLVSRASGEQLAELERLFPAGQFFSDCGVAIIGSPRESEAIGKVAVVSAGTSDARVSQEAEVCAGFFGLTALRVNDVGIAGLPRLLDVQPVLAEQDVLIVVAGMEGALASVVASICDVPVIGVPTSVGYGVAFGGLTALFGMLVSCSPGLTVVNIDNGFGAAVAAAKFVRRLRPTSKTAKES